MSRRASLRRSVVPLLLAPREEPPIGLILCADKRDEQVELLQLDRSGIRVASYLSYLTELPPKKLLEQKLYETARRARAEIGEQPEDG